MNRGRVQSRALPLTGLGFCILGPGTAGRSDCKIRVDILEGTQMPGVVCELGSPWLWVAEWADKQLPSHLTFGGEKDKSTQPAKQ
jgi:hypothetical protein